MSRLEPNRLRHNNWEEKKMTHLTALSVCLTASLLTASANPIEYTVHSGYFEKNNSGLKGSWQGVIQRRQ
jgi:hypothetical protein